MRALRKLLERKNERGDQESLPVGLEMRDGKWNTRELKIEELKETFCMQKGPGRVVSDRGRGEESKTIYAPLKVDCRKVN